MNVLFLLNNFLIKIILSNFFFYFCILCFLLLSFFYKNDFFTRLDKKAFELAHKNKNDFLNKIFHKSTIFGNAIFHIFFSCFLSLVYYFCKNKIESFVVLFVLIFSWGLNRFLKIIFKRERPESKENLQAKRKSYCFPSGHVMASIGIYFFNFLLFQNFLPFFPWMILGFLIVFLIICTRLFLNHHFFTDILGGVFMGIVSLKISFIVYLMLKSHYG